MEYEFRHEIRRALQVAAAALDIASDWGVVDVQVDPPSAWGLEAYEEDAQTGWCSTAQLAVKLQKLAMDEKLWQ